MARQLPAGRGIDGLRLGGRRVTRARYPNSDPEFDTFPTGWVTETGSKWALSPSSGNTLCKGATSPRGGTVILHCHWLSLTAIP